MNRRIVLVIASCVLVLYRVAALPPDIESKLASENPVTLETLSLAAGLDTSTFDELALPDDPVSALRDLNLSPGQGEGNDPATAGEAAYLIVRLYHLPTGLLYNLFPGPHYALVECRRYGLFPKHLHDRSYIDGETLKAALAGARKLIDGGNDA